MIFHQRFPTCALTFLVLGLVSISTTATAESSEKTGKASDTAAYSNYLEFRVYPMQDGKRDEFLL